MSCGAAARVNHSTRDDASTSFPCLTWQVVGDHHHAFNFPPATTILLSHLLRDFLSYDIHIYCSLSLSDTQWPKVAPRPRPLLRRPL